MYYDYFYSPIGTIKITATDDAITSVLFVREEQPPKIPETLIPSPLVDACKLQLEEYFARTRHTFNLPLSQTGTDFQQRVREKLQLIPYGKTVYYKTIAEDYFTIDTVRAVAAAIGQNKIDILIPCHRVLGSNGNLTGYNGGIERKRFLLALEQENIFS